MKIAFLLLSLLLLTVKAYAASEPPSQPPAYSYLADTWDLHVGVFSPQLNTEIVVNKDPSLPGTFIDLENLFGLSDQQNRPWLELNYRTGTFGTLRFIYFDVDRSGTRKISKDIRFGEKLFSAPSTVSATNTARYYWLSYQILLLRNVVNEFAVSPGVMLADVSTGLSLRSPQAGESKEVSFLAPMPLLGLYLSSQFMPKLFLKNTVRVMDVNAGDYEASLFNYSITLDYNPLDRWGIGVGYFFNRLELRRGFTNYNGRFTAGSSGGLLYLKYFFP